MNAMMRLQVPLVIRERRHTLCKDWKQVSLYQYRAQLLATAEDMWSGPLIVPLQSCDELSNLFLRHNHRHWFRG